MSWLTNLFRRPARSVVRRSQLALESLEERQLLSSTPLPAPPPPPGTTGTALVFWKDASRMYRHDGQLTKADAISLFNLVDNPDKDRRLDGPSRGHHIVLHEVNSQGLKVLDMIFDNPSAWGMSQTVASEGEAVLQAVNAGSSDAMMRNAVNTAFGLTR
jgi:hypothetical protein